MKGVFCHLHPTEPAEATCSRCLKPICSVCLFAQRRGHFCPTCLQIAKRNLTILQTAATLLACGLFGLFIYYFLIPPMRPGRHTDQAGKMPIHPVPLVENCDRRSIIERVTVKLRDGEPQQALDLCDAFFSKCGEHLQLRQMTYTAYEQLSRWDEAISEVDKLIADEPYNKNFRAWRGLVYEEKGDFERAIRDYRQALLLDPQLRDIPFNLATLLERTGKPCEAIFPLEQFLFLNPEYRDNPEVRQRLATLYKNGSCKSYTGGHDEALIRFHPGAAAIPCKVKVNNVATGNFIVDTGASHTTFSKKFAERLGIYQLPFSEIIVSTASGISSARLTTVDLVDVDGLTASQVNVAIIDSLPDDMDGLLGLSFLSRFQIHLDSTEGTLKIVRTK